MGLLPVAEALERLLTDVVLLEAERVTLADCLGRVLAEDVVALRAQPPFPASAMDGYAVRAAEAAKGARLAVAGQSRAGERLATPLPPGAAARIFTGAPVPEGADAILIQENATAADGTVVVNDAPVAGRHIRRAGLDFERGSALLRTGHMLEPQDLSLAAAMGHGALPVRRRPRVAILANGDELVPPGDNPGPDQIVSSNGVGLAALVRALGGEPLDLGIAADRIDAIAAAVAGAGAADVLVVSGGASVGDHDLIQRALTGIGMRLDFWRIAMRPGKPLMVGRLGAQHVLGLPGNPVSTFVCAHLFLKPLVRALLGLPTGADVVAATLGADMPANDEREDYVRATLKDGVATPFPTQDSSMLATFAAAGGLIVRVPRAAAAKAGERVTVLRLRS